MFLSLTTSLYSQTFFGGIRGRVEDPGGAAVPKAAVTLIDQDTGVARSTVANDQGEYVFSAVVPATYRLVVEIAGFKRFERTGIIIATQAALVVDVKLEVGVVTESIQVTEETPLTETSKADTGQVLDNQKLEDLPNPGRNVWLFSQVTPTVIWSGSARNLTMHDQGCSSLISIGGGLNRSNNYLIDGIPITDTLNRPVVVPNIEAIQEVKLQIQTYDAEVGRTGGGMFNSFMKSGTNTVHGAGYTNFRPNDSFANNFFNNRAGLPAPTTTFKDYGGSLGGPVWIPHVYNGKNRTFFQLTGEDYSRADPASSTFSVPTAAARTGDFSNSLNSNGSLKVIYDPYSTTADGKGGFTRTAFPGNVIPAAMMDPVGRNLVKYFPSPNGATQIYGAANYVETITVPTEDQQETAKIDHSFALWWQTSFSYVRHISTENSPQYWKPNPAGTGWTLKRRISVTNINNTITINPTTVFTVRYGFNRMPNQRLTVGQGFDVTTLGLPDYYATAATLAQFPGINSQVLSSLGPSGGYIIHWYSKNLLGSVSKFVGHHNLKVGADYRAMHVDFLVPGQSTGTFAFDDTFTRQNPLTSNNTSGADLAGILLGIPTTGSFPVESLFKTYYKYYSGYFQDDVRVRPSLTLNLGIRYEWETGLYEDQNHFTVGFDQNVVSPIAVNISGVTVPDLAPGITGILPRGGLMFAGVNGNHTYQGSPTPYKVSPRLGFAWAANAKTTIRGGFGVFWVPLTTGAIGGASEVGGWGYSASTPYVASNDGNITPANHLSNPFPSGINRPVGNSLGLLTQLGGTLTFVDQNKRGGYMEQFSMDIQRELPGKVALSIGYTGSRGHHLPREGSGAGGSYNINEVDPRFYSLGDSLNQAVPNPFYGRGGTGVIGSPTVTRAQLLRPFPEFGNISLIGDSKARSRYDSLIVKTEKRFTGGLSVLATWTWSKALSDAWADDNVQGGGGGSYQTVYDLAAYSLSNNHTPDRVTLTTSYELPFGRGKLISSNNRIVNWTAGGWQLNGIIVMQTGFPISFSQNSSLNGILFAGTQRPNATGISPNTPGSVTDRIDSYFNSAAFSAAPRYTFGNTSRMEPVYGPGIFNCDLSIFKTFTFSERWKAQFRAEAFNALNHPQFGRPNSAWGSPNFGRITSQLNSPRFVQMGVRFFF
jgi:hypothetical protein